MKAIKIRFAYAVTAIILVVLALFTATLGGGSTFASAASQASSAVLDDLSKDETFNINEYPIDSGDYGLYIKQIAESTDGELLIYVYQPAAGNAIKASSINIAREMDNSAGLGFKNYKLEFQNSDGVFFKYKVLDFALRPDAIRYYNISEILRPWDKIIDSGAGAGNTISEVPSAVAQFWTACTVAGEITYSMTESEVIEIKNKYVGYCKYDEDTRLGWTTTVSKTAAHFVAFSTDKPIDKLMSASISFNEREVTYQLCGNAVHTNALNGHVKGDEFNFNYGNKKQHDPNPVTVKYSDKVLDIGKNNYTWDRIRSTSEFLADSINQGYKLTSGDIASVERTKWVLNFYETPILVKTNGQEWLPLVNGLTALLSGTMDLDCCYTEVSDVMILELEFETEGQHFKLGAIDNKQTGSGRPWGGSFGSGCNADLGWMNAVPWWGWVLIIVFTPVALLVAVFLIYKLVIWLITELPKIIKQRRQERRERKEEERQIKLEQEKQMRLYKHRANLERKERNRQRALDEKEAQKAQKVKDKQDAKRKAKAAQNKRKAAKSKDRNKSKGGAKK